MDWGSKMKTKYNVKLLNGSKQEVTYEGVETVTLPDADSDGVKQFTAGEPLDDFTVTPDFSEGDQTVEAPEGTVIRSGTITKPEGAEAVIAKGETLMGIEGEYVTPGTSKTVELDFSAAGGETVVLEKTTVAFTYDEGNEGSSAILEAAAAASAILVGEPYIVTWDGTPYECEGQNIGDYAVGLGDLSLFGGSGNQEPFTLMAVAGEGFEAGCFTDTADTSHTFSITHGSPAVQTITAEGDERWSEVVINKPENLTPENIAKDVEIAGVVGTNQGIVYAPLRRQLAASMQLLYSSQATGYSSGTLRIMVPSDATIIRALLSYKSSYGASMTIPSPVWTAGDAWPSVYISGSWRVYEAAKSFTYQYSLEKHVWAGGVEYTEASQPLYLDALVTGTLGAFHVPAFSTGMIGGYAGGAPYEFDCDLGALRLPSYASCAGYQYAFSGIFAVTIESGDVPSSAFNGTHALLDGRPHRIAVVMASAAKNIGNSAFYRCEILTDTSLEAVETIGSFAFYGCTALKTLSFPRCTDISSGAFSNCVKLASIYFLGNSVPALGSSAFSATPIASGTGNIFVRASMLGAFQSAVNWSAFSGVMVGLTDAEIAELEE